jgi:hypothetical protein
MGRNKQPRARNEIEELREENRQLRELVAHLSQLALIRIAEAAKPREQVSGAESSSRLMPHLRSLRHLGPHRTARRRT